MTEKLILPNEIPFLPFTEKAGLMARMITYFTKTIPITNAIAARNLYVALSDLDTGQLASLGIARTDIAVYAVRATGILKT